VVAGLTVKDVVTTAGEDGVVPVACVDRIHGGDERIAAEQVDVVVAGERDDLGEGEAGVVRVQASGRDAAGEGDGVVALARINEEDRVLRIGKIIEPWRARIQRVEHVDVNSVVACSGVYLATLGAHDVDDGLHGQRAVDDGVDEIRGGDLAKRRVVQVY